MTQSQIRALNAGVIAFQIAVLASAGLLVFCDQAWSKINGGGGGSFFRVICPPNTFLIGFDGRAGNIIERMQLVCAGFTKTEGNTNFQTQGSFLQGAIIGAGTGGSEARERCQTGFVKEIRYNTRVFNDFTLIESIRLECRDLKGGESSHLFGQVETTPNQFKERCPRDQFVVGLEGRVGLFVDAVGPICAVMP